MSHIDVIIQGPNPTQFLLEIDSIIQQLSTTGINDKKSRIVLKCSLLCGNCIKEQISTQPFTKIDENLIMPVEGFDDYIAIIKNNNNKSNAKSNEKNKGQREENTNDSNDNSPCSSPRKSHLLKKKDRESPLLIHSNPNNKTGN